MRNRIMTVIILIVSIISLTACSSKDITDLATNTNSPENIIESEQKESNDSGYGYATDNKNKSRAAISSSKVYADNVELAEPYKLDYTEQRNPEEETVEEIIDIFGIEGIDIEDIEETEEVEESTQEGIEEVVIIDTRTAQEKAISEVRDIASSIYYNGYALLGSCKSVSNFNDTHDIDMDSTISMLKRNLENLEYCDSLIYENLSGYKNIVSSWNELCNKLNNYQSMLANVETAEDYIEQNITGQCNFTESYNSFIRALNAV